MQYIYNYTCNKPFRLGSCSLALCNPNRHWIQHCSHWQANCEANEVPVFNVEHNWQAVRGPASLGELAVDTKATNYGLVRLHWHLALLMHAVLFFGMKSVKVQSLFDRRVGAASCLQDQSVKLFVAWVWCLVL